MKMNTPENILLGLMRIDGEAEQKLSRCTELGQRELVTYWLGYQEALEAVRVERAQQNSRKEAHEILGVVEGIDQIRRELVNNRIDTEELIDRLQRGIADPLCTIAQDDFPELERRLEGLRAALDDATAGPELRDRARQQADEGCGYER